MKSRFLRRAGALLLALTLACSLLTLPASADDEAKKEPTNIFPEGETKYELNIDEPAAAPAQLSCRIDPSTDDYEQKVIWKSSNEKVIKVDENGQLTLGGEAGDAVVTATSAFPGSTVSCSWSFHVYKLIPAKSISIRGGNIEMIVGDEIFPEVVIDPKDTTDKIVWESSAPKIAALEQSYGENKLVAKSAGEAVLKIYSQEHPGVFAERTVTVKEPAAVTKLAVDPDNLTIVAGGKGSVTATLNGATTDKTIEWSAWPSNVITFPANSQSGRSIEVRANDNVTPGTRVTLSAKSKADPGFSDVCIVTVIATPTPTVQQVEITSPATDAFRYVDPGATLTLEAQAVPVDAAAADRVLKWSSSDTSIATVDQQGKIKGKATGTVTITVTAAGNPSASASREIEVSGIKLSYLKRSLSGGKGETIALSESSVVDIYQNRDITASVQFFGNAKNKVVNWESSNVSVASVVTGRVTANYPGEATITATVANESYTAKFKVRVSEDVADAIEVNMGSSPTYSFAGVVSELNKRSQTKAGAPLDSLYSMKVSTENGTLYYKYNSPSNPGHGVGGTERYYYQASSQGQMALKDVTFVPLPGFGGTAVVEYNAEATSGAAFSGTIRIRATSSSGITYSTEAEKAVSFAAEHFSAICKGRNGRALGYVVFSQPSASQGTLYYNYSPGGQFAPKVDSSTRYYASSKPSIDDISFVPAAGFTGTVSIPYRCTDSAGASFTGTVTVTVYGTGSSTGSIRDVEYSTGLNERLILDGSDFSAASRRVTGDDLDRIRFTSLPRSSVGDLYLNYTSSSIADVTTKQDYYRGSTPRISNISFVPARNYSGTVSIPFTGYSVRGTTFSGNLIIHVADGGGTVHYNTGRNQEITFSASDFNSASRRITGTTLNYIRFTDLPRSSAGTLYYDYFSSSSPGSRVNTETNYRRSGSPSISDVTFVPASGYTGTVTIPFMGYDNDGDRFEGTVTVTVGEGGSRVLSYSVPTNSAVRFSSADFNSACRTATGNTLDYVRFQSVSSGSGALYFQYSTASRTGTSVSTGTNYYYSGSTRLLSDVSFVSNSSSGTTRLGFTGYSVRGDSFSGTVEIRVGTGSGTTSGPVYNSSAVYYTGSSAPIRFRTVDFQSACQAARGGTLASVQFNSLPGAGHLYQNYSSPARPGNFVNAGILYSAQDLDQITYLPRAEYQGTVTIPYTAYDTQGGSYSSVVEIQLSNSYCTTVFTDVASGWDWAKPSIEFLRQSGITSGYRDSTFRPGQSISRGEFTLMVCRAFQFSTNSKSGFPDVPAGSSYAGAVAAAKELGIVQGNNGRFQPDRPITRQSAMTMICRALQAAGQAAPAADASLLASYGDGAQVSSFARSSVAALIQMGAVRGNSSMRLNPTASISRAEMAVILHRVLAR